MSNSIPDLWRMNEADAERIYNSYICRLWIAERFEETIAACRQIRRYATRGPGDASGLFTYFFEIEILCSLKEFKTAWRQLRQRETKIFGHRLDLLNHQWEANDIYEVGYRYAPILFFLERYELGKQLLEKVLGRWIRMKGFHSELIIDFVINRRARPSEIQSVCLIHFYKKLGMNLANWQDWEPFVKSIPSKYFRRSGVVRGDVLDNPKNLRPILDAVIEARFSSPASKTRTQSAVRNESAEVKQDVDRKLAMLFPEIR